MKYIPLLLVLALIMTGCFQVTNTVVASEEEGQTTTAGQAIADPRRQLQNDPESEEAPKFIDYAIKRVEDDSHPEVPGFSYLSTATYSCNNATQTVHEYVHDETGLEFVLIPGGTFQMGSPDTEKGRFSDEGPVRTVTVQPFLLGKYEITEKTWRETMETEPWLTTENKPRIYTAEGDYIPAAHITWNDAQEFCQKTGLALPSEAQWEFACRSMTQTPYYWGTEMDGDYCWYYDNAWNVERKHPREIGRKKPNAFGLHDMLGNVAEWCEDSHYRNFKGAPNDETPRVGPKRMNKVNRGASFCREDFYCRSAFRYPGGANYNDPYIGFRVRGPFVEMDEE